ncbi:UvrD-helicase domain-containing protein [Kitasatospora sp. NBC_01246]|uniref:UvrD-helicase domain-containing protein n=1 Tax=Kitasatospora sp. NBC_01246 TaxID=2903570 RepID=UPI002E2EB9E4|nr:UvrD-helicase domain-containing protein [Kitasatospora sp. NBC_01246]
MTLPLSTTALDRESIEAKARSMGLALTSPEQFAFLEARGPLHLQAAPGSGKTTLVALKLALVADDWSSDRQGICVLSHTNTATQEIASRLTGRARRLEHYPHFVGTFQSFVHTFLALPALRSLKVATRAVDDQAFAAQARRLLDLGPFTTLRAYLKRRSDGLKMVTEATYVFDPAEPELQVRVDNLKRGTASYKQLMKLKEHLFLRGVFRYADMYAIATRHLHQHPRLAAGLRSRFPFVLIDEMQDTGEEQRRLLEAVFKDGTVVQCVGDVNQRILSADGVGPAAGSFLYEEAMELPVSLRFGAGPARVASRLAVHRPQEIRGHGPESALALITFTKDSIVRVLPAFDELVRRTVPPEAVAAHPPKVLGARESPGTSQLFPRAVGCYLPQPDTGTAVEVSRLLQAYRRARAVLLHTGQVGSAVTVLWGAVRALLWELQAPTTPPTLPDSLPPFPQLDRRPGTPGHHLRVLLVKALHNDCDTPAAWEDFVNRLGSLVREAVGAPVPMDRATYAFWLSHTPLPQASEETLPSMLTATVASAKGETHCATLVLECATKHGRSHDLGILLPVITGATPVGNLNATDRHAAMTTFVAATRARHLLALAVHEGRANPHLDALARDGWSIVSL